MKAQFFLFNIEGYGEFFSGITPSCSQRLLNNFAFKYFGFERIWWKLFQKHAVCTKFDMYVVITPFRVSEWLLFSATSANFQLYHGENKLILNEMMIRSALYQTNTLSWIFIVLVHWNNIPWVDMSLHSDTLFLIPSRPVFALSP